MKYKTFRNLAVGSGLMAFGGMGYGVVKLMQPHDPWEPVDESVLSGDAPDPAYAEALVSLPQGQETRGIDQDGKPVVIAEGTGQSVRFFDELLFQTLKEPARAKVIDYVPEGWDSRIRLYDDTGSGAYTRLRIDRDNDQKWDEKWTLDKGRVVSRKVSPNEDEQYTQLFRLDEAGRRWLLVSGPLERTELPSAPAETATADAAAGGAPGGAPALLAATAAEGGTTAGAGGAAAGDAAQDGLRPVDQAILSLLEKPAKGDKLKDAVPGQIKVNLYHDDNSGRWNRLKIDLDRDEKWDEKWTMERGRVLKRQVAPADDEKYAKEYRLENGRWVGGR